MATATVREVSLPQINALELQLKDLHQNPYHFGLFLDLVVKVGHLAHQSLMQGWNQLDPAEHFLQERAFVLEATSEVQKHTARYLDLRCKTFGQDIARKIQLIEEKGEIQDSDIFEIKTYQDQIAQLNQLLSLQGTILDSLLQDLRQIEELLESVDQYGIDITSRYNFKQALRDESVPSELKEEAILGASTEDVKLLSQTIAENHDVLMEYERRSYVNNSDFFKLVQFLKTLYLTQDTVIRELKR